MTMLKSDKTRQHTVMNDRIRELIEQSTKVVEPNDPDYRDEFFDKKKFAELIIRECIEISGVDSITKDKIYKHFLLKHEDHRSHEDHHQVSCS